MRVFDHRSGSGGQIDIPGFGDSHASEDRRPNDEAPAVKPEVPPTDEEWVDLYCAAAVLKKVAPWQWMWDSEVFGVKDPESGVIGYCAVTGQLGEHLALGVYLGASGLAGLDALREKKKRKVDYLEFLSSQHLLQVSFEDRTELDSQDLKVIKRLEFVFRGKKSWPLFRSYRPGFMPWFITGSEARFLNVAIRQALYVTQRLQDKPDLLEAPRPGMYLVRVAAPGEGEPAWHDEWLEPAPLAAEDAGDGLPADVPADPALLARIRARTRQRSGTWEVDVRPSPVPISPPGERPYIPLQILIADHDSGIIFDTDIRAQAEHLVAFREHFIRLLDKLNMAPARILIANQRTETVLKPITEALAIPVERVLKLVQIEPFFKSLEKFLYSGGRRMR